MTRIAILRMEKFHSNHRSLDSKNVIGVILMHLLCPFVSPLPLRCLERVLPGIAATARTFTVALFSRVGRKAMEGLVIPVRRAVLDV